MATAVAFIKPQGGYWPAGSAIVQELEELGIEVDVFADGDPAALATGRWLLFRGSAGWYPRSMRLLSTLAAAASPRALLWLTEPLPPPPLSSFEVSRRSLRDLAKLALRDPRANDQRTNLTWTRRFASVAPNRVLAVSTVAKVETLAACGVGATFVPFGGLPPVTPEPPGTRDLDVLFLGDPAVPHRRRALRALRRAGIEVISRGAWDPRRGLWGEERAAVLGRTKLLVNLSRHPGNAADARLGLGATYGAVTVSEPMYRPDPWIAGTHFVEASLAELPDLIRDLLADDARRERLAVAAAELARTNTLAASARSLLRLIGEGCPEATAA